MKKLMFLAILAILTLELVALMKDVDGYALAIAIGAIAGLGGYTFGRKR